MVVCFAVGEVWFWFAWWRFVADAGVWQEHRLLGAGLVDSVVFRKGFEWVAGGGCWLGGRLGVGYGWLKYLVCCAVLGWGWVGAFGVCCDGSLCEIVS